MIAYQIYMPNNPKTPKPHTYENSMEPLNKMKYTKYLALFRKYINYNQA